VNTRRHLTVLLVATGSIAGSAISARAADETQRITVNQQLRIPGAVLQPGRYTFAVEDRLQDRAIVRITSNDRGAHYLVLTVPNRKLRGNGTGGLVFFRSENAKQRVILAWACPGCRADLEFVYPKAEALQITDAAAQPVMAVDPSYDKLPENLSPDDIKVVTLWLLSPTRIAASGRAEGVNAERYSSITHPLPETASNNFGYALFGLVLLAMAGALQLANHRTGA
jgi:hypothetical protein